MALDDLSDDITVEKEGEDDNSDDDENGKLDIEEFDDVKKNIIRIRNIVTGLDKAVEQNQDNIRKMDSILKDLFDRLEDLEERMEEMTEDGEV